MQNSQANIPPVQPVVPDYLFQHISCDYFELHGHYFAVAVQWFSNWFNIYEGKGGAASLVEIMKKLFQDFGLPQTLTSDGGPQFISDKFQAFLRQYGVHQRLTSVGFAYANTRVELGVKTAKMLQGGNMSSIGKLANMAVTKALLMYRNNPEAEIVGGLLVIEVDVMGMVVELLTMDKFVNKSVSIFVTSLDKMLENQTYYGTHGLVDVMGMMVELMEICASEPAGSKVEIAVVVSLVGSYCVALGAGQGL